jgi:hypothetical protein
MATADRLWSDWSRSRTRPRRPVRHDPHRSLDLLHTGRSKTAERSLDSSVIAACCPRDIEQWVETSPSECRIVAPERFKVQVSGPQGGLL